MKLGIQKRLAASIFKHSSKKVWFDEDRLPDIKEAITKHDIKSLITEGVIRLKPIRGNSRGRTRAHKKQVSKGLRRGAGSRKGKRTARIPKKEAWMNKVRIQRFFLKELRDKELISKRDYQQLYLKSKGGFFRSKRHIKLFIEDHDLVDKSKVSSSKVSSTKGSLTKASLSKVKSRTANK